MNRTALIMSDAFAAYNFGKHHPLKPERVLLTWELITGLKLHERPDVVIVEPKMASDEEIAILHEKNYIEFVKHVSALLDKGSLPEREVIQGFKYNLGPGDNPVFPKMHEGSAIVAGGTMIAADTAWEDNNIDTVFNAAGGLHHAMANRAAGFCIYNDPAIAIKHLLKKHAKESPRIMYIDIDAHHGDGVQAAFYDNPDVLTVSIHESGEYLFPGTGFLEEQGEGQGDGFAVNIPLLPYTYDDLYLDIFDDIVPALAKAFQPDLILSQNGVDTHCTDPLANLGLTTRGHREVFTRIHDLAKQHAGGKLVAIGGGGYNLSVVPRSWTMLFAELCGALDELPTDIPEALLGRLNDGRVSDIIPPAFIDDGPSQEIKIRMDNYKFMDMMELHAAQLRLKIQGTIIPKIEGRR